MNRHRELRVWQDARKLVGVVYKLTDQLPPIEPFVALVQLRRAVWSVHNNIAEGNAKLGRAELRRFYDCAIGSLAEVDAMVLTLGDLYRIDHSLVQEVEQLRKAINGQVFAQLRRSRHQAGASSTALPP